MPIFPCKKSGFLRSATVALTLALSAPLALWGQQGGQKDGGPKKELSDKVAEELGKIRPHIDAQPPNYDAALTILETLLRSAAPESFDLVMLSQYKAQILLQKGDYAKSIQPLETALTVADRHGFFEPKTSLEMAYYLAQLYTQETTTTKDPVLLKKYFGKAVQYIERWIKNAPKPDPEKQLFLVHVLYMQSQIDPDNVDMALIKRVQEEAEKGLLMSVKPKDTFYVILLAALQHQNNHARAAELLELLVRLYPKNKSYWANLANSYLNLQQDVRAVLTFERAQQNDTMNSPKDNYNLVGILFNMGQYEQAIDLLSKGLRDGSIENEQKNWELLVASLQQVNKQTEAIEVLKEAIKLYPDAGNLYILAAQIYYAPPLDNLNEAYNYAKIALTKKLEKPWQAQNFFAYICYELKKLDEALVAVNAALANPEGSKEPERLKKAIEEAIKDRDANSQTSDTSATTK